jgi:hypothetical protein
MTGRPRRPFDADRYLPYALAGAPAAVGCAMGILLGGRLKDERRGSAAALLLGIAVVVTAPIAVDYVRKRIAGPGSLRGSQRRLNSIRDAAVPVEEGIYGAVPEEDIITF